MQHRNMSERGVSLQPELRAVPRLWSGQLWRLVWDLYRGRLPNGGVRLREREGTVPGRLRLHLYEQPDSPARHLQ
jgi:hypothetical protein